MSEETGTAYAYGKKFVYSWSVTSKNSLTANAESHITETYNDLPDFNIENVIPHESYVIDMYLGNSIDYSKQYLLPGVGIYIYDKNNVSMMAKPSTLNKATKLFQAPIGLSYMTSSGVMYTTNCEMA